ncbi:MND1-interacting protein 1 [Phalaenopsis equestris]|uniref:MND1-interacting protein 1 n=1 Tax=Phalaenopsis equestris TaxID=78828 RepID=UPI0009E25129|nr:MND1-interacting protein 1 [Phalaenopsis equestris]
MGLSAREKPLRPTAVGRKRHVSRLASAPMLPSDSTAPKPPPAAFSTPFPSSDPALSAAYVYPSLKLNLGPCSDPSPNLNFNEFDESEWGYCTEEQLEEIVISNLDCLYKEAISRLVTLGYADALALRAVLCNGHCYGSMDAVSNIMQNALAYLNTEAATTAGERDPPAGAFSDLRHLEEYSLAGMVCLLQQIRADLSRGEAMWCLLMSGLHVSRASSIELPSLSVPGNPESVGTVLTSGTAFPFVVGRKDSVDTQSPSVNGVAAHPSENVKRFHQNSPTPFLKSVLKPHNTEYCPELNIQGRQSPQHLEEETEDLVQLVLKSLEVMRIEDDKFQDKEMQDQKKEMIMDLICQIRELEGQVNERKEWAQQKAMQAARKLSSDLHELRVLRMEREENQRSVKGKQVLEESTMKRLAEMESSLKKASGQVDRANAVVKKLETENAEIRAEMEASKLSASESVTACMEVSKREKKCLKKLVAWEKQKGKLQEEIAEKRKKILLVQQQLAEMQEATKQAEIKWRHELKEREEALSALEVERRVREAAEANCKRRQDGLRQKIEIDFQRYKDDIRRLEEELSRHREVAAAARLIQAVDSDAPKVFVESYPKIYLPVPQESSHKSNHRLCWLCRDDEVSVVFLPCAHQVLCYGCNDASSGECLACKKHIEERIHVYGAKS